MGRLSRLKLDLEVVVEDTREEVLQFSNSEISYILEVCGGCTISYHHIFSIPLEEGLSQ